MPHRYTISQKLGVLGLLIVAASLPLALISALNSVRLSSRAASNAICCRIMAKNLCGNANGWDQVAAFTTEAQCDAYLRNPPAFSYSCNCNEYCSTVPGGGCNPNNPPSYNCTNHDKNQICTAAVSGDKRCNVLCGKSRCTTSRPTDFRKEIVNQAACGYCTLSASPNVCTVNPAASTCAPNSCCASRISWTTSKNIQVFVQQGTRTEQLFGQSGAGNGSANAPWIQCGYDYVFRGKINGVTKCSQTVRANCPVLPPTVTPTPPSRLTPTPTPTRGVLTPTPTPTRPVATITPAVPCVVDGRQAGYGQVGYGLTITPLNQTLDVTGWTKTWGIKGPAGTVVKVAVTTYICAGGRQNSYDICGPGSSLPITSTTEYEKPVTIPPSGNTTFEVYDPVRCCWLGQSDVKSVTLNNNTYPWRSSFFIRWAEAPWCPK